MTARRPAGVAREAAQSETDTRAVLVVVDARFTAPMPPDADAVARAADVRTPSVLPLLDAGLLEDGTRWYVTPAPPGPVLDPGAGCSPRRAATVAEEVARALAAVHAAGLVHGLVGPRSVVPAAGRHAERPVARTVLLDTGVAALVGDRAAELAAAAGVALPRDRGAAADVHALGALLLRMLTAAAPAGPALAALPVELRALLSEMLDDDPGRRPTALAVAQRLAALREGLLGTGPVTLPQPLAGTVAVPPRTTGPAPVAAPAPALISPPTPVVAAAPAPVPRAADLLVDAPVPVLAAAPSLRTGPIEIRSDGRPARRRGRTALLAAGGVGLAGLLVGVLAHLPAAQEAGIGSVVAAAEDGVVGVPAGRAPSMRTADARLPTTARAAVRAATSTAAHPTGAAPIHSARAGGSSTSRRTSTTAHRTATSAQRSSTPRSTGASSATTSTARTSSAPVRVTPHLRPSPTASPTGTPPQAATPAAPPSTAATTPPATESLTGVTPAIPTDALPTATISTTPTTPTAG